MNSRMNVELKDEGVLEITEEQLTDEDVEYGAVGYWRSDGNGHAEKLEPYFHLSSPGRVTVTTNFYGSLHVSLNLFNDSTGHGGPTFPQQGGSANLGPGQWRLYFTGWISTMKKSGIDVRVQAGGLAVPDEAVEVEESIEEERGATFKARAKGSSRPQAIRIAYRRADGHAGGKPYSVLDERVYAEANYWICILTCELI